MSGDEEPRTPLPATEFRWADAGAGGPGHVETVRRYGSGTPRRLAEERAHAKWEVHVSSCQTCRTPGVQCGIAEKLHKEWADAGGSRG